MTSPAELVARLREGSSHYAGRGSAASGRLRAQTLAAFAELGLPADAVPYVVEALRTEVNVEVVAAAARATRGWAGADPELAGALLQALVNLRGHDAPVDLGVPSTALREVLAALRAQPVVDAGLIESLQQLQAAGAAGWESGVRRAFAETIDVLGRRVGIAALTLEPPGPPSLWLADDGPAPEDLTGVVVEDQDGVRVELPDYLQRAVTAVAFFYTRCANPNKCSLTITKLADLQQRLAELAVLDRQLAAISYDPGYDRPARLAAYGRARGLRFDDTTRMFRAVEGHDRMRAWFGLRVGYNGSIVNQHGIELYLVEPGPRIAKTWARIPWSVEEVAETLTAVLPDMGLPSHDA
jgi:cytochrome oxidase Cu insertion factor (SCO1/SenC/PrrC family)